MTSPTKALTNAVALLAVLSALTGCRRSGEPGAAAASPGAGTYSPAPGAEGGVGTFTDSSEVTVHVIGVDEDASSITVTEAEAGPTADRPGTDDDAETGLNLGARGTADAIAGRRTLTVTAAAAEQLSRLKAGDRVTLTCRTEAIAGASPGTTGTGSATGPQTRSPLDNCTAVAGLAPAPGGGRGR